MLRYSCVKVLLTCWLQTRPQRRWSARSSLRWSWWTCWNTTHSAAWPSTSSSPPTTTTLVASVAWLTMASLASQTFLRACRRWWRWEPGAQRWILIAFALFRNQSSLGFTRCYEEMILWSFWIKLSWWLLIFVVLACLIHCGSVRWDRGN